MGLLSVLARYITRTASAALALTSGQVKPAMHVLVSDADPAPGGGFYVWVPDPLNQPNGLKRLLIQDAGGGGGGFVTLGAPPQSITTLKQFVPGLTWGGTAPPAAPVSVLQASGGVSINTTVDHGANSVWFGPGTTATVGVQDNVGAGVTGAVLVLQGGKGGSGAASGGGVAIVAANATGGAGLGGAIAFVLGASGTPGSDGAVTWQRSVGPILGRILSSGALALGTATDPGQNSYIELGVTASTFSGISVDDLPPTGQAGQQLFVSAGYGAPAAGATPGSAGGVFSVDSGFGGDGSGGQAAGAGGAIGLNAGWAGANAGGGGNTGGTINVNPGKGSGAGVDGDVNVALAHGRRMQVGVPVFGLGAAWGTATLTTVPAAGNHFFGLAGGAFSFPDAPAATVAGTGFAFVASAGGLATGALGGAGGSSQSTGGPGGAATAGFAGGQGGSNQLIGGVGGAASAGQAAGPGGTLNLVAGAAGSNGLGGGGAAGGNAQLDAGAATGGSTAGQVRVGVATASKVVVGRALIPVLLTGDMHQSGTDASGAPGAATINASAGRIAIAMGSQTVMLTNSLITTGSLVFASVETDDATAISVKALVANGSVTFKAPAMATGNTTIAWLVVNLN